MSNFLLSLLFGLGVGAWVYGKSQRRNGGLSQQSLIAAAMVGFFAFVVFFTVVVTIL